MRHPDELVLRAPWSSRRPSIWRTRRTPASWSPLCLRTPSRPGPFTSASTAHGATWRHDQGAAARSLLRPDLGRLLRRQPAPASLLRLRIDPLLRPSASTSRHPAGPGHRGNAPAQAPQDWCPRHRLGSPGEGRHKLRPSFRRSLRPGPRSITRVGLQHLPATFPTPHLEGPPRPRTDRSLFSTPISSFRCFENPPEPAPSSFRRAWPPPVTPPNLPSGLRLDCVRNAA